MNRFVYLINNRTGCKVRCVNPVFQYKLGLLIKKLKKYKNELKQNKISKELLLKIRKTLNETLSLLGINNKSSKLLSRSSTDYCDLVEDALVLLIIYLKLIQRCNSSPKVSSPDCDKRASKLENLLQTAGFELKYLIRNCLYYG